MDTQYGGFWRRFAANFVDGILLYIGGFALGLLMGLSLFAGDSLAPVGFWWLISTALSWVYSAVFESSSWQATPGKKALNLKVTTEQGGRISFGRATARHFAKIVSVLTLFVGFLMIAFTDKKQGLHDLIARTLIVKR